MAKTMRFKSRGDNIKVLRKELHLSQEEMAHLLGVTVTTLSRWANDRVAEPDPAHQERIATLMDLVAEAKKAIRPEGVAWWFRTPHPYLSDLSPLDLLPSLSGMAKVRSMLGSMVWGLPA